MLTMIKGCNVYFLHKITLVLNITKYSGCGKVQNAGMATYGTRNTEQQIRNTEQQIIQNGKTRKPII